MPCFVFVAPRSSLCSFCGCYLSSSDMYSHNVSSLHEALQQLLWLHYYLSSSDVYFHNVCSIVCYIGVVFWWSLQTALEATYSCGCVDKSPCKGERLCRFDELVAFRSRSVRMNVGGHTVVCLLSMGKGSMAYI